MFVHRRNLSCFLLVIAGTLFLLLPPQTAEAQTAGAGDAVLCNDPLADPDARIPACTRLLGHPSGGINLAEVYNHRGAAKVRTGYLDDAIADFTSALNQNPRFVDAFKNRGIARHMQGAYDAAIADFNRALRLDATSPDLYNARGSALFKKEEYDRAIVDFNKAISLDPNYKKAFVNRGLAFHFERQLDRAIADFDMFVRLAPNEPIGYLDRASVRMDEGNFKGAVEDYDQAIRLDPNNSGAFTRRGEAWRLQGNLEPSLADHNKAIALNPNDKEAYNNRALTLKDQGKLDYAIADCDQAIMLDPAYDLAYATRGLIRRLKGQFGRSLTDLNKALTLDPRSPIALTFRGDTLRESQNLNGAMEDFNKAIMILPDFVAAYAGRGLTYEKLGNLPKTKADFEKALSLSADLDAGLARPAQTLAREHLAVLAAEETARAEAARAEAARAEEQTEHDRLAAEEQAKRDKDATATIQKAVVPDDIQQALDHRGHALLIGVSDYTTGWDKLPSVKDDLGRLEEGLKPSFETVEKVLSPTVEQIRLKIHDFLMGQWNKANERLLIYYSGHGFTDRNPNSWKEDGYITGSDTPVYKPADGSAIANALPFAEVVYWSGLSKARHVLMVFDSCFSGSLFASKSAPPAAAQYEFESVQTRLRYPIRYVITAGRGNETVAADGIFADSLLRGLRGEADFSHKGIVAADQLGAYLSSEVPRLSANRQNPQYDRMESYPNEGQFFFLTKPAATGTSAPLAPAPIDMTPMGTTANGPGKENNKRRTK